MATVSYRKKVLFSGEELDCEGCLIQVVSIPPNSTIPPHHHKVQTEAFYILEGEAELEIGDMCFQAKRGDSYLCKPCQVHQVKTKPGSEFKILVFKTNYQEGDIYWQ